MDKEDVVHTHTQTHTHTHTHTHMHTNTHIHTNKNIHTHTHIHTNTHIHKHTHKHIYTLEYYSAIKKNEMPFAATWMDLETVIPSEASQTKTSIIWGSYVESKKKKVYKRTNLQIEIESQM